MSPTRKVYLLYEEYDPYVDYPDISSRAEVTILGVFTSRKRAMDIRNSIVLDAAKEYDVRRADLEKKLKDWKAVIRISTISYYIYEFTPNEYSTPVKDY